MFNIPKIFPDKPLVEAVAKPDIIDLKSALVPEVELKKISKLPRSEVKPVVEEFVPQFIDCDIKSHRSRPDFTLNEHCELFTVKEFKKKNKHIRAKDLSIVGKIISMKFKKSAPKIHHGYEHKHVIQRFGFDTPSPDDKILAHLNKTKNTL